MFDNPASESWNPKVSTAPGHGLYLYDLGYDEADLAVPIEDKKLKLPVHSENQDNISLDLKKEIIKQRIENRRISLNTRISKSREKIKNHELLRSAEK
jgi:hypothetical protein